MFLRYCSRKKDGKEHRYWSIVENKRVNDRRVVQRHVGRRGRAVCARTQCRSCRQGACDQTASTEVVVGTAQATKRHDPHARAVAHEAWCGKTKDAQGLAADRDRG